MKLLKQICAVCLVAAMLALSGITAVAMEGGGIQETEDYTIGIDLSVWNIGGSSTMDYSRIDFEKAVADGCDFAILRIGLEGSATRKNTLDLAFLEYYDRAREAGMKLGVYFYALGTTYAEAVDDAQWVINVIEENNMYFEYPIYYDVETGSHNALTAEQVTNLCLGWCETLESEGYFGGIYGKSEILSKLSDDFKSRYDLWLRYIYSNSATSEQYDPASINVSDQCSLWQYTMFQKFDGINNSELDGNVCYKDYPAMMLENGYNNCGAQTERNLASNKKYFTSDSIEGYTADLTDGYASTVASEENSASWFGFENGGAVVLDLGGTYDIAAVRAHIGSGVTESAVSVSSDGENFELLGALGLDSEASSPYWANLDYATQGRYIKIEMSGTSVFLNEIEVLGCSQGTVNNVALGKDYDAPAKVRAYTADLNDGKVATTFAAGSSDWYGLFYNTAASDQNCPTGTGTIIFDLGDVYDISGISVNVGSSSDVVSKPDAIKVYASYESKTAGYSDVMFLTAESDSAVYRASAQTDGLVGRYVKIEVVADMTNNYWTVLDEIEIYSTGAVSDYGKEIEVEYGNGSSDGSFIRGDVDGNGEVKTADYIILKRILLGAKNIETLNYPETAFDRCDVDANGEHKTNDYLLLKRALLGLYTIPQ